MTLLPSSSTHQALSLPRTRGHAAPRLQLPSLPSLSNPLLAPALANSPPLPTPRSTLCVPLSRRAPSLSSSFSIPSLPRSLRSLPFAHRPPSPFPPTCRISIRFSASSPPPSFANALLPSSLPPFQKVSRRTDVETAPPPFDHGSSIGQTSDSLDSAVNDEQIRVKSVRGSVPRRVNVLHFARGIFGRNRKI